MATASRQRSSSASRTLPTRKSKAASTEATASPQNNNDDSSYKNNNNNNNNNGIESRQESKSHDSPGSHRSTTTERIPSPPSQVATDGKDNVAAMLEKEQRDNNSSAATTKQQDGVGEIIMQPAFNLNDIGTLDHPPRHRPPSRQHQSPSPTQRRRSASPPGAHTSAISRRGRSRSPVGLTPHHHHRHPSNSSRSNSRSNSRPTSRCMNDGRASAATVQAGSIGGGSNTEMSLAALAAGEAAANSNLASLNNIQPMPYKAEARPSSSRSPSPHAAVMKFPSASMSFEIASPQQSMSFGGLMGGLGDSFDWMPQHHHQQQGRSPSPPSGGRHHDYPSNSNSGGRYEQQRHPPPSSQDGHGYYNYPPPATQAGGNHHHRHHNSHFSSSRGRSPSPPGHHNNNNGYYNSSDRYSSHHHNHHHHRSRHSRSSSPNGRNEHLPRRSSGNNQQPLFPEHHIQSPGDTNNNGDRGRTATRSRSASPTKRSSSNGKATHRSSVFRGSPQRPDTDNLPQELLLALEEEDDSSSSEGEPNSPPAVKKRKGGSASNKKGKNDTNTKKGGRKTKKDTTVKPKRGKELPPTTTLANPSMSLLDPHQIDACLQDTSLNLNVDDYLTANLSFRKSYDLEQVFSFIKEPHGGLNGALSFNLGFSNEEDDEEDLKNKKSKKGSMSSNVDLGIHTLRSQSMGLTPINSFSETNKTSVTAMGMGMMDGIVPLNSMDGKELRAFFSSSPNTLLNGGGGGLKPLGLERGGTGGTSSSILKIGSPKLVGRKPMEAAPVVHSTPPSYSSQGHEPTYGGGSSARGGGGLGSRSYTATTPPSQHDHHAGISMSFPNKRIKLSSRHTIHPIALDLNKRGSDYFGLLRKLKPAFVGFRFILPEMDGRGSSVTTTLNVVSESNSSSHTDGMLDEHSMIVAKRRISSSICAFGGSLPPRTVSPSPPSFSSGHPNSSQASHGVQVATFASSSAEVSIKQETSEERNERYTYESSLSSRYFMKEGCVSWDVELHEVIAAKPGKGGSKKNRQVASTPKPRAKKQIGVFKGNDTPTKGPPGGGGKYCAPVTPSTPGNLASAASGSSTPGTPSDKKGSKIQKTKYRCKLCGLPKQNHTCTYKASLARSIGTMVYPAVNAFVSNEPGRLAPALSEMNNFTSLLSHDTTRDASLLNGVGASFGMNHRSRHPSSIHRMGPYGNVLTPDTSHWSPNTPGGLSTMSSPGSTKSPGTPGTPAAGRKRDHHHLMMSRTMSMGLTATPRPPPVPHVPSMPPAPAGAIPHDVLFRDTMELKKEQYRTVGGGNRATSNVNASGITTETSTCYKSNNITPTSGSTPNNNSPGTTTSSSPSSSSSVVKSSSPITESITDYRYPQIPTPYSQRKEMGDTLFALSREVPNLADSCAAILREARENDAWDQAVAELTTQVLVVLKCDESDYTLEGLRRHLLSLGIAC